MEEQPQTFKIGDIVKHVAMSRSIKIYVANATDTKILGRYVHDGVIHSVELFNHEISIYEEGPTVPLTF